ncbi:MAG: sigma factor-like helix-turn-helix DNA-binding protein [Solirubrobacteraceae bacterium]
MATVTTRLAIDSLRSARARREQYIGAWLPEPILSVSRDDPARHAETADSRPLAMLVLLESLSPEQRAVVLLRGVFDYGYDEIAQIVGMSEDNVRQLAGQAGAHLGGAAPAYRPLGNSARNCRAGSSQPWRTGSWPDSRHCSRTTCA